MILAMENDWKTDLSKFKLGVNLPKFPHQNFVMNDSPSFISPKFCIIQYQGNNH